MLIRSSQVRGCSIVATDGPIGSTVDLLFDDTTWLVRWLVVDTGDFLPGHKVLIPPCALSYANDVSHQYAVRMTKQQIKDSPGVETDEPVSRAKEKNLYNYYGWRPYWSTGFYIEPYADNGSLVEPASRLVPEPASSKSLDTESDGQLRSVHEVDGYHIHASDGTIGRVVDFLVEDGDWSIRYLIVDTSVWWVGKAVLVSPRSVLKTNWPGRTVDLDVTRQQVRDSPAYDSVEAVDRAYERQFHGYYNGLRAVEPA
jgi:hypothetical protein